MLDFGQTVKVFAINFSAEVTKLTVFPTSTSNIEAKSSIHVIRTSAHYKFHVSNSSDIFMGSISPYIATNY